MTFVRQRRFSASSAAGGSAEFERAMIRERVLAGIARARSEGRALGRKRLEETDAAKGAAIRTARAKGGASPDSH